ncbi:hypothetical protein B0H13DRAFT_2024295 [Mycena leptocephala]|nr:hypothetical protein B0H13DRAFT_2024295 [Mycena leptocephala]
MTSTPVRLRRERQKNALELVDDLQHELEAINASSPDSKIFQATVVKRLNSLKRRYSVTDADANSTTPDSHSIIISSDAPAPVSTTNTDPAHTRDVSRSNTTHSAAAPTSNAIISASAPNPNTSISASAPNPTSNAAASTSALITPPAESGSGSNPPVPASAAADKQPKAPRGAAQLKRAEERLKNIIHHANQSPLDVEEFLFSLQHPLIKRADSEDAAIGRLIRGYGSPGCSKDWRAFLTEHLTPSANTRISDKVDAIKERNQLPLAQRIEAGHKALAEDAKTSRTQVLGEFMLHQISVARFGIDWRELSGLNSRKAKQTFYMNAYQNADDNTDFFDGLEASERNEAMKDSHADDYKRWRKEQEPLITARNHFVDLYLAFGPALFLDPFWHVSSLINDSHTKEFPALLGLLVKSIPEEPHTPGVTVAASRWKGSRSALQGVARAIDVELWRCLRAFLDEKPDEVPLAEVTDDGGN